MAGKSIDGSAGREGSDGSAGSEGKGMASEMDGKAGKASDGPPPEPEPGMLGISGNDSDGSDGNVGRVGSEGSEGNGMESSGMGILYSWKNASVPFRVAVIFMTKAGIASFPVFAHPQNYTARDGDHQKRFKPIDKTFPKAFHDRPHSAAIN